jgi:transposase-like protein
MQNLHPEAVAFPIGDASRLPDRLQLALTDIAGAAREGLLAMSVNVGLAVMDELMEAEVREIAGPKGAHNHKREVFRHGHTGGEVTLGARRVWMRRPRIRKKNGGEAQLASYRYFAGRDQLRKSVFDRILAGVSMRRFRDASEPVGEAVAKNERSTSKSSISRTFVQRTTTALKELMNRSLADVRLAALMIDGIDLKGRTVVVALGITTDGVKLPLGLWEGHTENATVATALLSDLVDRGLDPEQGMLFVIDGAKALRKAIRTVFGEHAEIQRCIRHKERNVLSHLPESQRAKVKKRMREAWATIDVDAARSRLVRLADELGFAHPGAAASLREGLEETLTVQRLGITGALKATLQSSNPIESMISIARTTSKNVKNWQSGAMALRWIAAGMLEAEKQFRRVAGYRDLAKLIEAIERADSAMAESTEQEADTLVIA